jgi:hypothetical protein
MALINCPECNGTVSTKAPACPHCGWSVGTTPEIIPISDVVIATSGPTAHEDARDLTASSAEPPGNSNKVTQKKLWFSTETKTWIGGFLLLLVINFIFPDWKVFENLPQRFGGMSPHQRQDLAQQELDKANRASNFWHWSINYGILNDDIAITNQSGYELTNVTLDVHLSVNGKIQNLHLSVPHLPDTYEYRWSNVISVSKSDINNETSTAVMTSDETRGPTPSRKLNDWMPQFR